MNPLLDAVRKMTTQQIVAAVKLIGGDFRIPQDKREVRHALLVVYEEKAGGAACDALMDELGM